MSKVSCANAIGSLMYATVCTRLDISQSIRVVRIYMHNPDKEHWQTVKWILQNFLKTLYVGLMFQQYEDDGQWAIGFFDSNYVGDLGKHRFVIWKSTLLSTEAKYMAVCKAIKEIIWLQGLLDELGAHCDSKRALHLAKNQVYHARTKHIDVKYDTTKFQVRRLRLLKILQT